MPAHALQGDTQTRIHPNVVSPTSDWHFLTASGNVQAANNHLSAVCRVPVTGTLRDLMLPVVVSSGNVSVTVYSVAALYGSRTRLWTSGSVAAPGSSGWHIIGDPALAVTAGQLIALGMSCDNTTATFGRIAIVSGNQANTPAAYAPEGGLVTASLNVGFPDPGATLVPALTTLVIPVIGRVVPS